MLTHDIVRPTTSSPQADTGLGQTDLATIDDLDITFIEAGDSVEHLIYMTGDNCGKTCQSACTSCP